jgi:hypothetical protein
MAQRDRWSRTGVTHSVVNETGSGANAKTPVSSPVFLNQIEA